MDKLSYQDIPAQLNSQAPKQSNPKESQPKTVTNIILQCEKVDESKMRSFTPTRKVSSLRNDQIGTSSQQRLFEYGSSPTVERTKKLKMIDEKVLQLQNRVSKLQKIQNKINKSRRIRRRNDEISKQHTCPVEICGRKYGTETALKKHVQLKHSSEKSFQMRKNEE